MRSVWAFSIPPQLEEGLWHEFLAHKGLPNDNFPVCAPCFPELVDEWLAWLAGRHGTGVRPSPARRSFMLSLHDLPMAAPFVAANALGLAEHHPTIAGYEEVGRWDVRPGPDHLLVETDGPDGPKRTRWYRCGRAAWELRTPR